VALRLKPDFTGCRFNLACVLSGQQKLVEAEAEWREILRLAPSDDDVLHALAWLLATSLDPQLRKPPEAGELAQKVVERKLDIAAAWNTLGVALYRVGQYKEAVDALEKSLELQGENSFDLFFLAMAAWQLGNHDTAHELYAKAATWMDQNSPRNAELEWLRLEAHEVLGNPQDAWVHILSANKLLQEHKIEEALGELEVATQINPDYARAQFGVARVAARLGQWHKSAAAFARALELQPAEQWDWFQGATVFLHTGDMEGYRHACRELLHRFGQTEAAQTAENIAKACALAPDVVVELEQLMKLADMALDGAAAGGTRSWYAVTKGLVGYRAGRWMPAIEFILQSAPNRDGGPRDALAFAVLALAHHRLGNLDTARTALADAQRILSTRMPDVETGQTFGTYWHNWLQCQLLCREAEALLNATQPTTTDH